MKIKELNENQKKQFKLELSKYKLFCNEHLERLSNSSKNLYARSLSYISVINNCCNFTVEQMCIDLCKKILTDETLNNIIGDNQVSLNNQNIRISAFKNLIEVYKDSIKKNISNVAYKSILQTISQNGNVIRKNISIIRNEKEHLKSDSNRTWDEFLELKNIYLKKFKYIKEQYLKYYEVPDYHFLRDCLVCNLYCNNVFKIKSLEFNVILRNEYKSCYLHIGDDQPPNPNRNYFWIKLNSNDHRIVINKNKTTGGIMRKIGGEITPQKNHKFFPLNKEVVKIILFIKQCFQERIDKPFIKCNNRELNYSSSTWSKMLGRVFKSISPNISCNVIRKVYDTHISWDELNETDKNLILCMNDLTTVLNPTKKTKTNTENLKMTIKHLQKTESLTPQTFLNCLKVDVV